MENKNRYINFVRGSCFFMGPLFYPQSLVPKNLEISIKALG